MINSNKGCFWIKFYQNAQKGSRWLTVTKVVFEFNLSDEEKAFVIGLTVTKVVFEFRSTFNSVKCTYD